MKIAPGVVCAHVWKMANGLRGLSRSSLIHSLLVGWGGATRIQLHSSLLGLGTLKRVGKLFLPPVGNACCGLCVRSGPLSCFLRGCPWAWWEYPQVRRSRETGRLLWDLCGLSPPPPSSLESRWTSVKCADIPHKIQFIHRAVCIDSSVYRWHLLS